MLSFLHRFGGLKLAFNENCFREKGSSYRLNINNWLCVSGERGWRSKIMLRIFNAWKGTLWSFLSFSYRSHASTISSFPCPGSAFASSSRKWRRTPRPSALLASNLWTCHGKGLEWCRSPHRLISACSTCRHWKQNDKRLISECFQFQDQLSLVLTTNYLCVCTHCLLIAPKKR